MNLKKHAEKLKSEVPAVFLALKDKETPIVAKIFAGMTIVYALSPIDLIPDFVPVLGYLDDLLILPLLVALAVKFIPTDVWERSLVSSKGMWKDGKPKRWYYAVPIVLFWIFIIIMITKILGGY